MCVWKKVLIFWKKVNAYLAPVGGDGRYHTNPTGPGRGGRVVGSSCRWLRDSRDIGVSPKSHLEKSGP